MNQAVQHIEATNKVAEKLKTVLADSYTLYLKTQNFHWNVTGPNFKSLHVLFEEQYTDLAAAIDDIAERIRTLGEKAPGSFTVYRERSEIAEGDESLSAEEMVKQLSKDQTTMVNSLKSALVEAQKVGDEVTVGMLTDRMSVHEKNAWMLNSSI